MGHERLRAAARRQRSLFTYDQAIAAGVTHDTIWRNVRRQSWEKLEPRVYRSLPAAAPTWEQRVLALVLSTGGVAFGRSACALYGLLAQPSLAEVLVVRRDRNRLRAGLHSTRALPRTDIARVIGIPATMPARAICDAAATLPHTAVCELVDAAVVRELVRPAGLLRRAAELRNSKRPGCTKVLAAVAEQHPRLDQARNEWEALVVRLARRHGLPVPVLNHPVVVGGQIRLLDAAWPEFKVDLEFDGFREHMVRKVFDDDRARQNDLVDHEWLVYRATSNLLRHDPAELFGKIRRAIERRGHYSSRMREVS